MRSQEVVEFDRGHVFNVVAQRLNRIFIVHNILFNFFELIDKQNASNAAVSRAKRLIADAQRVYKIHMSKCWEDQVLSSAPIKDCPLPWSWMLGSGVSTLAKTRPAKWNFNWVPEDFSQHPTQVVGNTILCRITSCSTPRTSRRGTGSTSEPGLQGARIVPEHKLLYPALRSKKCTIIKLMS